MLEDIATACMLRLANQAALQIALAVWPFRARHPWETRTSTSSDQQDVHLDSGLGWSNHMPTS